LGVRSIAAILLVASVSSVFAQLLDIRHDGETTEHYCARIEKLKPNLVLVHPVELSGRIKKSMVKLRAFESTTRQTFVKRVFLNDDGEFDLADVDQGRYRPISSPTRALSQAEELRCGLGNKCSLRIMLKASPTDQPEMFCPVR